MGLFDRFRKAADTQFIEIIEWLDDSSDTLVHRFPVRDQEIKMGAMLTVRENQQALLVNEGRAADLFSPGLHTLTTRNIPILTKLRGWKYGFKSPFKAEVYFFNTRLFADLQWGTSQPVMMRDKEFGMVRLRAFGTYATRIVDAKRLFAELVGTRGLTTTDEITGQLRSIILTRFSDAVAESGIPALDLASLYNELSDLARESIAPEFRAFGLELSRFFVENISLPDTVQAAIDQRSRLGVLGGSLTDFTRLQAAEAMTLAAGSEGGAAGAGVGIGAGAAMGQMMGRVMTEGQAAQGPPPPPAQTAGPMWTLSIGGRNYGPYGAAAVREMLTAGRLTPGTLAWKPGAAGWAAVSTYPEFEDFGGPPPPPEAA